MPVTYEPIASTTLTTTATNINFTSIPQTYTDLVLICNGKFTNAVDNLYYARFNSDTGSNYSETGIYGDGSSVTSGRDSNVTSLYFGRITSTAFNYSDLHLMNYSNTTTNKSFLSRGGTASGYTFLWSGLWRSTAAISSIQIICFATGGTFTAGSSFALYGIKAA